MDASSHVRPTVWIVDDSPLDAQRARQALGDGFDIELFVDGSTVLERLAAGSSPVVMVLDWVMPAVSGLDVLDFLRTADPPLAQLQILLLTARQSPEQIVQGLDAGANDYLPKPYTPEELRARVGALLRAANLLARAQQAEAAITSLVASSPDAMLAIDASGAVRFGNTEARRILGAPDVVGRPLGEVVPQLAERLSVAPTALHDLALNDRVYAPSIRTLPESDTTRSIVTLRDVTERRQNDQRRLDFYSIIAHDLRSPLQSMMMRTAMLRQGGRGSVPPVVLAELAKLDANHQAMIDLINDFLTMARTEATAHALRLEPVDLTIVTGAVVESLEALATSRAQKVRWVPSGPALVQGDRRGLSQVLGNLLGNALKFSPDGAEVEVRIEPRGAVVRAEVRDAGPGIPADEQATLFDRFTRGSSTIGQAGTGLGLMIVQQLVEAHGGQVGVHSELGAGSTFWFEVAADPRHSPVPL